MSELQKLIGLFIFIFKDLISQTSKKLFREKERQSQKQESLKMFSFLRFQKSMLCFNRNEIFTILLIFLKNNLVSHPKF